LHLATHGFFAPPTVVSALRSGLDDERGLAPALAGEQARVFGLNPLLLSGVVLAPAPRSEPGHPDEILTAEEVTALDLGGTELVVLSACETGLGQVAHGEGVLGLQRAFHAAGARATAASLWKVDDAATSLLMEKFYEGLWRKKLGKLEALRQAQLFVLKNPDAVEKRRKELAAEAEKRGLKLDKPRPLPDGGKVEGRSHPALWAAFVLSGDSR
jgi:CHAT domain-containing protein